LIDRFKLLHQHAQLQLTL